MLHRENPCKTEKEKLLEFVSSLTQEEVEIIVANFAEIVASLPASPLPGHPDRTSPNQ